MSESEVAGSDIYMHESVTFRQGNKYLINAQSGHGKSSLLNFIYGSSKRYEGHITFKEETLSGHEAVIFETQKLRTHIISYMFQELCLFPELTAMENVQLKNRLTNHKDNSEIESMLDMLLPSEKKGQPVGTLSIGQQQRVAAVRALCQPFKFLLLDEPFSHIDKENARLVANLIIQEVDAQGAGLIITSLDRSDAIPCDYILNL